MGIHNCIRNWIMDIYNCRELCVHDLIMGIHNSIMDVHDLKVFSLLASHISMDSRCKQCHHYVETTLQRIGVIMTLLLRRVSVGILNTFYTGCTAGIDGST